MRRLWAIDLGGHTGRGIGIDPYTVPRGGIRADFLRSLPLKDNSIDVVYAYHVLEHAQDLLAFMAELWRACKPNALVYLWAPHATSPYVTWADPTQRRGFLIETFAFLGRYREALFDIEVARLHFTTRKLQRRAHPLRLLLGEVLETLANRSRTAQYRCERWWGHWLGFEEVFIVLRAVKGEEWERRVAGGPSPGT